MALTDLGDAKFACVKEEVRQPLVWLEQLAFCGNKNHKKNFLESLEAFPGNFAPMEFPANTIQTLPFYIHTSQQCILPYSVATCNSGIQI